MAHPDWTLPYASGTTAAFASANPARWILALGAGTVTMTNAGDADGSGASNGAYPLTAGNVVPGEWTALVSTTCSNIIVGSSSTPPPVQPAQSGVLPGTILQGYANGGATLTGAFTPAIGTMYGINPSGATFAYTFPAISAANDGQKIAIFNVSTGTTATVAAPTGSDNVGNSAGASTGATAAGPVGGAVKTYTADNTRKAWIVGI